MVASRGRWRELQKELDISRLIFLDESGFTTNMTRRYGRAPRGVRLVGRVPHGHWKTTTLIAGLRFDRLVAPMLLDGAMDGEAFSFYVEQILAPELRDGDIVVLDNLSVHRDPSAEKLVRNAGARLLFLPPYSPDMNPIEQVFAKLKALTRAAEKRTVNELWDYIATALKRFPPRECKNFFANCGYGES